MAQAATSTPAAGSLGLTAALAAPLQRLLHTGQRRAGPARLHAGDGQPVIVFPVLGGGPASTADLRRTLAETGFDSHDWGLGVDTGPRDAELGAWLRRLEERVIDVFESARQPVTLLGWSLSGLYAREVAKRLNPLVRQVITMGTPFNTAADPDHRCMLFKVLERSPGAAALQVRQRIRQCPPVPFTSIYSKADGVVPWELCVDVETPTSENVEVEGCTHAQLAQHPRVLEIVTHRLAQPQENWMPFRA
jgi:hypothetical protein